jgi:hypothetical protein
MLYIRVLVIKREKESSVTRSVVLEAAHSTGTSLALTSCA